MILWLDEEQRRYGSRRSSATSTRTTKPSNSGDATSNGGRSAGPAGQLELDLPRALPPPRRGSRRPKHDVGGSVRALSF
jgi:hypothetical protein